MSQASRARVCNLFHGAHAEERLGVLDRRRGGGARRTESQEERAGDGEGAGHRGDPPPYPLHLSRDREPRTQATLCWAPSCGPRTGGCRIKRSAGDLEACRAEQRVKLISEHGEALP